MPVEPVEPDTGATRVPDEAAPGRGDLEARLQEVQEVATSCKEERSERWRSR